MSELNPVEEIRVIELYIKQLSTKEHIAHNVAISSLGSSFDISKSIGYIAWYRNRTIRTPDDSKDDN
jgi:hypothetical protein